MELFIRQIRSCLKRRHRWPNHLTAKAGKQEVTSRLEPFNLNETAIEAEAVKIVFPELEILDGLLTSAQKRRNKALRLLSEFQAPLARRAREVSKRIIAENETEDGRSEMAE